MSEETKDFYEFDRFHIDLNERVLMCDGEMTPLTQKAFEVLLVLVERRGHIVSKDELLEKVWPDTFVEESNLAQNIYTLRKTLGQMSDGKGYIETVPRRGYRFVAKVRSLSNKSDTPAPAAIPKSNAASETPANNAGAAASPIVPPDGQAETVSQPISENLFASGQSASPHPVQSSGAARGAGWAASRKSALVAAILTLGAITAGAFWLINQRGGDSRPDDISRSMTVTALTTSGNISTASISPDGAYVAYATRDKADQSTLWIEQLSTSTRRAIIPASAYHYYAMSFSRDGSHVYYTAATNAQPRRALYRVSVLGGTPKKLLDEINAAVSFSPDGSQMVIRRAVDQRRVIVLSIADADGGNEREFASIKYPELFYDAAWSPDGKSIASAAGNPNGPLEMYVMAMRVGEWSMRPLTKQRWRWIGQLDWLRDSRRLVMVAQENSGSPRQVWLLDSITGEVRRITNDTNVYNRLSLAAAPGAIAALQVKQLSNVWVIPAGAVNQVKPITSAAGGYRGEITWTPDGKIVFDSEAGPAPAISIMDADGRNTHLLTGELTGRSYVGHSMVSPDGRSIAFASDLKGVRNIWRINIDGSNLTQLTKGTGEDNPCWSPDGQYVLYSKLERDGSGQPIIERISIANGEIKKLTSAFTAHPSVSPDGKYFACLQAEGPGPNPWFLAIYPFEGGRPEKVFSHPIDMQTPRWKPDGREVTYAENPVSGPSKIWLQPLDGGAPKLMTEFETDRIFGLDWSRDGKYLACVRGLWATNVALIKNFE